MPPKISSNVACTPAGQHYGLSRSLQKRLEAGEVWGTKTWPDHTVDVRFSTFSGVGPLRNWQTRRVIDGGVDAL